MTDSTTLLRATIEPGEPDTDDEVLLSASVSTNALFDVLCTMILDGNLARAARDSNDDAFRCSCASVGYFADAILMREAGATRDWSVSNKAALQVALRLASERELLTPQDHGKLAEMLRLARSLKDDGGDAKQKLARFENQLQMWDSEMSNRHQAQRDFRSAAPLLPAPGMS